MSCGKENVVHVSEQAKARDAALVTVRRLREAVEDVEREILLTRIPGPDDTDWIDVLAEDLNRTLGRWYLLRDRGIN
jgi:hypothetical protein